MRTFLVICAGRFLTALGSGISAFALSLWIFQQTHSVTQFSAGLLLGFAPGVLAAPAAGALIDRHRRRTVLLWADSAAMLGAVALAVCQSTGHLAVWQIYAVTVVESLCAAFQWPALAAAVTGLVPPGERGRASAMTQTALAGAQLLGPMLAAVIISAGGLRAVLFTDVVSFALGLATLAVARFPEPVTDHGGRLEEDPRRAGLLAEALVGWRLIRARRGLSHLLWLSAVLNAAEATATALLLPLVLAATPAAEQTSTVAAVSTAGGLGMAAGSVLMSVWRGPRRRVPWITGAAALSGGAVLVAGFRPQPGVLAVVAFVFFLGLPVVSSCAQVIWQEAISPGAQGRAFSIRRMLTQAGTLVGLLVAGPLAEHVFTPLLVPGGLLADNVGLIVGVGPDRGTALFLVCTGTALVGTAIAGRLSVPLGRLETRSRSDTSRSEVAADRSDDQPVSRTG